MEPKKEEGKIARKLFFRMSSQLSIVAQRFLPKTLCKFSLNSYTPDATYTNAIY
jgi:hypothetical protein